MGTLCKILPIMMIALFCTTLVPQAGASEWDKKTIVTFNEPVTIPGQVLSARTYVFIVLDSASSDRNIVQIWNQDQTELLAMTETVPMYASQMPEKAFFNLEDRFTDSPRVIRTWFYPGDAEGHEFIYQQGRSSELDASRLGNE